MKLNHSVAKDVSARQSEVRQEGLWIYSLKMKKFPLRGFSVLSWLFACVTRVLRGHWIKSIQLQSCVDLSEHSSVHWMCIACAFLFFTRPGKTSSSLCHGEMQNFESWLAYEPEVSWPFGATLISPPFFLQPWDSCTCHWSSADLCWAEQGWDQDLPCFSVMPG